MPSGRSFLFILLILSCITLSTPQASNATDTDTFTVDTTTPTPAETTESVDVQWNKFALIVCGLLNAATAVVLFHTMRNICRIPTLTDKYRLSMHWLSRAIIRVSIGPTGKKLLTENIKALKPKEAPKVVTPITPITPGTPATPAPGAQAAPKPVVPAIAPPPPGLKK